MKAIKVNIKSFEKYQVEHDFPGIGHRKVLLNTHRIVGKVGEPQMILLSMDIIS